jgi:hypothetical protein
MKEANTPGKKPYEKPELRVIEMKEDEVLAVGCKMPAGPSNFGQPSCGIGGNCNVRGS